jgi:hypothetical protein
LRARKGSYLLDVGSKLRDAHVDEDMLRAATYPAFQIV